MKTITKGREQAAKLQQQQQQCKTNLAT